MPEGSSRDATGRSRPVNSGNPAGRPTSERRENLCQADDNPAAARAGWRVADAAKQDDAPVSSVAQGPEGTRLITAAAPLDDGTPPVEADDWANSLLERLAIIEVKLDAAVSKVDAENDRAAARERVIDHLHGELERLRSNERNGQLRSVITDLRRLRTGLLRQAKTLSDGLSREQASTLLESFALDVELALERCGVTVLPVETGEQFSAERHQAMKVETTDDASLDGAVAGVAEDGYRDVNSGKIIAPAKVVVNRFSEREEENTND